MADLRVDFAGIESPNPFWLASGPPTNTYVPVAKAFDMGWGGAVWKTIGDPIINVFSRYGSVDLGATRMMGFNNIELISDRPIDDNLKEIAEVKRNYPKHAIIASLMVESKRETWHDIVKRTQDTGADGAAHATLTHAVRAWAAPSARCPTTRARSWSGSRKSPQSR